MKRSVINDILNKIQKKASAVSQIQAKVPEISNRSPGYDIGDDAAEEQANVGVGGLIAASEKLLAINRGLDKPDDRDSIAFKRVYTTDRLMAERIRMDADRVRASMLPALHRQRSLKVLPPFAFDGYMEKYLLNNPLSSPLEEINPLHLAEQYRRATLMGPGGIGVDNAITQDMQSLNSSQFGFIDPLAGPECFDDATEVFTRDGWMLWENVKPTTELACCLYDSVIEYHKPFYLVKEYYAGELFIIENSNIRMAVTPTHRVFYKKNKDEPLKCEYAETMYGENIKIPMYPQPNHKMDKSQSDSEQIATTDWRKEEYTGYVYCASVPGSKVYVRGKNMTEGYWSGNSEKIGIDTRFTWGTKIGNDGKLYQRFFDKRKKRFRWMSPEDVEGLIIKLPE